MKRKLKVIKNKLQILNIQRRDIKRLKKQIARSEDQLEKIKREKNISYFTSGYKIDIAKFF